VAIDWLKLQSFDRRWLFLAIGLAIALPLMVEFRMPFTTSERVEALHREIERLPPGTRVLLAIDYDPASKPELEPFARAVLRHLLLKRCRVVLQTLWDKSPPIVLGLMDDILVGEYGQRTGIFEGRDLPPIVYGRDYVFFGFKEGKEAVIAAMGRNFRQIYPADFRGRPTGQLPIMDGINRLSDFPLIIEVSAGFPGAVEYVQQVVTRYNLRFAASTTSVSVTNLSPYYPRQMFALIGGMRGAAEYEALMGQVGLATRGLNVLTVGHVVIVLAITLGNLIYFKTRKKKGVR
jgi:hypothetical protein